MKYIAFVILTASVIFCSCNQPAPTDNIPHVGSLDTAAIAEDTIMQKGLEVSYEYHHMLTWNANEVFDIAAWGAPTKGELAFIYRSKDGVDTVAKAGRVGIVKGCWVSDLNNNKQPEVAVILQNNDSRKLQYLSVIEMTTEKKAEAITFDVQLPEKYASRYKGNDSIYYVAGEKTICQMFPLMDSGKAIIKYKLEGKRFVAASLEEIDNTGKVKSVIK